MPLFDDGEDAQSFKTTGSGFSFSGVNVNNLGASEYTLVHYAVDRSGSVGPFLRELEGCVKSSLEGCQRSPRVDNLLVRLTTFDGHVNEEHGFRPLADCHLKSYDNFLQPGGVTALYDATGSAVDAIATYGKQLTDNDYKVNGLVVVLTDGGESGASTLTVKSVQEAFARARMSEALESLLTILIGVNITQPAIAKLLKEFKDDAGFDQYIEIQDASPKNFAKIAGFISKSVSSQSQAIGTGAKSQLINF
jgi:hypothetical protein